MSNFNATSYSRIFHQNVKRNEMPKSVLIICTSKDKFEGAKEELATGSWMEEVAAPYYVFKGAGYDVKIASINGGEVSALWKQQRLFCLMV